MEPVVKTVKKVAGKAVSAGQSMMADAAGLSPASSQTAADMSQTPAGAASAGDATTATTTTVCICIYCKQW